VKTAEARPARLYSLAVYIASQCLSQATGLLRALVVPNLLGPAGYGLVATVNALDRYTPYVSVGAHYYVLNRFPLMTDDAERRRVTDSVFGFTLLTSLLAGLLLVAAAVWQVGTWPAVAVFGVATLALSPLASGVWRLHVASLRVDERIPLMTRLTNAQSLVTAVLLIVLTWGWGVVGTFTAQLLSALFVLGMVAIASPYRFRPRLQWPLVRMVLAFSVPVFVISGLLTTVLDSTEIFVVAHRLGVSSVGVYAWGVGLAAVLYMWTNAITTVYSSQVVRAAHGDDLAYCRRLLLASSLIFVALASLLYVLLPIIVVVLFPSFESGLAAARLLILSAYYESLSILGLFVVTAQNRFTPYLVCLAVLVVVSLPLLWWVTPRGILWVAALVVLRRLCKAHVVLRLALGAEPGSRSTRITFYVAIYALGLVPLAAGWLVDLSSLAVTRANVLTFMPQIVGVTLAVAGAFAAVLYGVQRQFRLLGVLWQS
jgi:O-antigen/teichoic acid export membrane protein